METALGLIRDFLVAAFGVALLFGVSVTQEQIGAIITLVSVAVALGTYAYNRYQARGGAVGGVGK
jgi:hypothetical protein